MMFLLFFGIAMVAIGLSAMILSIVFATLDLSWNIIAIFFQIGVILIIAPFIIGLLLIGTVIILALFGIVVLF